MTDPMTGNAARLLRLTRNLAVIIVSYIGTETNYLPRYIVNYSGKRAVGQSGSRAGPTRYPNPATPGLRRSPAMTEDSDSDLCSAADKLHLCRSVYNYGKHTHGYSGEASTNPSIKVTQEDIASIDQPRLMQLDITR